MHPIPQRCAGRPMAGGLVVPYVTLIHNGHAAFGALDADKALTAFRSACARSANTRCTNGASCSSARPTSTGACPRNRRCTTAHCPMLNGTATHYRRSPVLASHPAGRPCTDPSCPCPPLTPGAGPDARSGSPADRYEAWLIHTASYRLVLAPDRTDVPMGISVNVPVLRRRVLRTAALTPEQQHLMDQFNALMNGV